MSKEEKASDRRIVFIGVCGLIIFVFALLLMVADPELTKIASEFFVG